jgi:hypothetical protein
MPRYLATTNVPGYLPMDDDPPIFDTPREAWAYLADERRDAEDSAFQPGDDVGFTATVNMMESLGDGTLDLDEAGCSDGTGTIHGDTPGYDGDHDLGLNYTVTIAEEDEPVRWKCEHPHHDTDLCTPTAHVGWSRGQ